MLLWSYRCEIWQASRQQSCRRACQTSEWIVRSKSESRCFETSRDLAGKGQSAQWIQTQVGWVLINVWNPYLKYLKVGRYGLNELPSRGQGAVTDVLRCRTWVYGAPPPGGVGNEPPPGNHVTMMWPQSKTNWFSTGFWQRTGVLYI